jgi:hypothetical protein
VLNTILVFSVIPLAIVAVVAALALAGNDRVRRSRRYRPGRPYDFKPIWFLASPEQVKPAAGAHRAAIEAPVFEDSSGARVLPRPVGGASDSW